MRWVLALAVAVVLSAHAGDVSPAPAAKEVLDAVTAEHAAGTASAEEVFTWSKRLAKAEGNDDAAWKRHLERMARLRDVVDAQVAQGMARPRDAKAAAYYAVAPR